jgi:hypothetical protein
MEPDAIRFLLDQGTEPLLKAIRSARADMSYQVALRSVLRGYHGIRLAAIRKSGRWHTSADAVRAFIAATTNLALGRKQDCPRPEQDGIGRRYLKSLGLDREALQKRQRAEGHQPQPRESEAEQSTDTQHNKQNTHNN